MSIDNNMDIGSIFMFSNIFKNNESNFALIMTCIYVIFTNFKYYVSGKTIEYYFHRIFSKFFMNLNTISIDLHKPPLVNLDNNNISFLNLVNIGSSIFIFK